MKKQLLLFLMIAYSSQNLFAQKEGWNWYFGNGAAINFSTGAPLPLTNSAMLNQEEGVSTISDSLGNLLFYSDGMTIYDSTNNPMPNGTGLLGNNSSTQSAVIVKVPSSDSLYYLFTVDDRTGFNGFNYSIIDMSLNNGLGDVSVKNVLVKDTVREKLTAIRHSNGSDYWILVNPWSEDDIFSYHLSSTGLDTIPVISGIPGHFHNHNMPYTLGYLKANRQNTKIALACMKYNVDILDFDNSTGLCSNKIEIIGTSNTMNSTYGVEFSPDGSKLYFTTLGAYSGYYKIFQFDLSQGTATGIYNSRTQIASHYGYLNGSWGYYYGALQLGPDNKIYCVQDVDTTISVINYPDSLGTSCGYASNAVSLGGRHSRIGFPNFISDQVFSSLSTQEINSKNNSIKIYPNPSNQNFIVSISDCSLENSKLTITNLIGEKVQEQVLRFGKNEIRVRQPSGIYFLTVYNKDGNYTAKIIVQ